MAEIETIFSHTDNTGRDHEGLGVNVKTGELYWNKEKIITEQKLTLSRWVNAAIIFGGFSTALLVIIECLKVF